MSRRITGLENEYGCLVDSHVQLQEVLPRIRDWLFENHRYGLIDQHDRDWDEPAGNGGVLFKGGRGFIDKGPPQKCPPGGASAPDAPRYHPAGGFLPPEARSMPGPQGNAPFHR